jgi:hypothetical protein
MMRTALVACMGVMGNAYQLVSSNLYQYFRRPNVIREADVNVALKTAVLGNTHYVQLSEGCCVISSFIKCGQFVD